MEPAPAATSIQTQPTRSARPMAALQMLGLATVAAIGLFAICVPFVLSNYMVRVATTVCMYLALAQSWNLIGGYAGLLSLAHPAFFGSGAIGATILLLNGASLTLAAIGGILLALVLAALIGIPTLRLQGHYFVVATMLITEAARNLVLNLDAFKFNGGIAANIINYVGLVDLDIQAYNALFFYVMAAIAAVTMLVAIVLERSRWGLALRAVRDDEKAASALGVSAAWLKISVFLISAGLAAAVGVAWAFWLGTVEANEAYNLAFTFEVIVMVFLGGRGTLWGPVLGVFIILMLNEFIGIELAEINLIVLGLIVMAIVLFQPDGLARVLQEGPAALAPRRLAANFRRYRIK
ncbi:branched-chain amino acid ABC transporter permease [Roseomonas chloroacetimidivorans]|uniref:branched-chain amino acid ABC transporter permease n=1 Tax=Roseomonas chloroacetimidivorans TaxID=1766656 RepID=UPI003C721F01